MVERGHTQFVEPSIKFLTGFNVPQEQLDISYAFCKHSGKIWAQVWA